MYTVKFERACMAYYMWVSLTIINWYTNWIPSEIHHIRTCSVYRDTSGNIYVILSS